jgi:transposase
MHCELTDYEWSAIKPMLPNKPRGVPRVNDRRALNGIFWVLRSGAPWRDLPQSFGPYTTCLQPFRSLAAGWRLEDPADVSWGKLDACGRGYISVNFRSSPNRTWL